MTALENSHTDTHAIDQIVGLPHSVGEPSAKGSKVHLSTEGKEGTVEPGTCHEDGHFDGVLRLGSILSPLGKGPGAVREHVEAMFASTAVVLI